MGATSPCFDFPTFHNPRLEFEVARARGSRVIDLASVSGSTGSRVYVPPWLSCCLVQSLDFLFWTTDHHSAKRVKGCRGGQGMFCSSFDYLEDLEVLSYNNSSYKP